MSAPTPGPWRADDNGRDVRAGGVGGLFVARTYAIPSEENPDAYRRGQGRANAHLIAAAPDLLAACRRALDWLASYPGGSAEGAYDVMRAAIAKAEGGR